MKRLYYRKRNFCIRMNYDKLKSVFEVRKDTVDKKLLDYEDTISIFHKNSYSYLVTVE